MTTPTGTISASDINTELGNSPTAQMSLNDSAVRTLAGIPSGMISFNDLRGKSSVVITLIDDSYTAFKSYAVSTCQLVISSDGNVKSGFNGSLSNQYAWCSNPAVTSDYEVYVSIVYVNNSVTGTVNQWVALSTSPQWSVVDPVSDGEPSYATLNVQIRRIGGTTILASAQISIEAERVL